MSEKQASESGGHVLTTAEATALVELGVTPRDLIRLRWPDASDEEADYLLWEETPWPMVQGVHEIADAVAAMPGRVASIMDALRRGRRYSPMPFAPTPDPAPNTAAGGVADVTTGGK